MPKKQVKPKRAFYCRSTDRRRMVEVEPHVFVAVSAARLLGLIT